MNEEDGKQVANDEEEAGEPISALRDLEEDTSVSFLRTIRKRIYRRKNVSQLVSVSWELPKIVLIELAKLFMQVFRAAPLRKED